MIYRPVSIAKVARVLGASSTDVKTLCCNLNINPRSKYKPVRYPADGSSPYFKALTDAELQKVNYGIVIKNYTGNAIYDNMLTEIENAINNANTKDGLKAFYYDRLSDDNANDVGRLTDFENYNHDQGNWFDVLFDFYGGGRIDPQARFRIQYGGVLDSLQELQAWGAFAPFWNNGTTVDTASFGFLMKRKGTTWGSTSQFYKILDRNGLEDIKEIIEITPPTNLWGETWIIYPCMALIPDSLMKANTFMDLSKLPASVTVAPLPYSEFREWAIASAGEQGGTGDDDSQKFFLNNYIEITDVKADLTLVDTTQYYAYKLNSLSGFVTTKAYDKEVTFSLTFTLRSDTGETFDLNIKDITDKKLVDNGEYTFSWTYDDGKTDESFNRILTQNGGIFLDVSGKDSFGRNYKDEWSFSLNADKE